jgi:microcystin-dependent protein
MPIPSTPSIMPTVLGYAADTVQIPETTPTGQGIPSFRDLFPFITQVDPDAGGVMVERAWMNALFNLLGQHAFFQQSGCVYPWQATLDYIAGCHVMGSNGIEYVAQQSSGPDVPGVGAKNPTTDTGVYWKASVAGGGRIPGEVVPFYNVNLGGPANRNPIFWGQSEPDTGWLICDGGSDGRGGSVPDLRGKFVMCSTYSGDAGQTGGAASVTPTVSVQNATQGGSIATAATGITIQAHTLGIEQIPSHRHSIVAQDLNETPNPMGGILWASRGNQQTWYTDLNGGTQSHTHGRTDPGHTHTFTGAAHTHAATANTINTLPPYYKIAYCVKLPE